MTRSYIIMREKARPILDAVDRHGSLDNTWNPESAPAMGAGRRVLWLRLTLAPRDVAAEGQLWIEENALERAEAEAS